MRLKERDKKTATVIFNSKAGMDKSGTKDKIVKGGGGGVRGYEQEVNMYTPFR